MLINNLECNDMYVRSYSGRSMYGKTCLGVVCDDPTSTIVEVISIMYDCFQDDILSPNNDVFEEYLRLVGRPKTDSFGRQSILYWPDIKWPEGL